MSESFPPPPPQPEQPYGAAPTPPPYGASPQQAYGQPPQGYGQAPQYGAAPIGQVRSTGVCILLYIVTFGIYGWFWFYNTSEEMKKHSGQGLGGVVSLLLAIFIGIVNPYITSSEVGGLYERAGRKPPVTGMTGLWVFPGIFIIVGPIVWFVKTNGALNEYWKSLGATA